VILRSSEKRLCRASSNFCRRFLSRFTKAAIRERTGEIHAKDGGGTVVKDEILPPRCGGNKIETRSASRVTRNSQPAENVRCLCVSPRFFFVPVLSSIYRSLAHFILVSFIRYTLSFEMNYLVSLVSSVHAKWNSLVFHLSPLYQSLERNEKEDKLSRLVDLNDRIIAVDAYRR